MNHKDKVNIKPNLYTYYSWSLIIFVNTFFITYLHGYHTCVLTWKRKWVY